VTIEITQLPPRADAPTAVFVDQATAAAALVELVGMFGHLPRPYVTLPTTSPRLTLQTDSPSAFEAWRVALQVGADDVDLRGIDGGESWLAAEGVFRGVVVELTGFGLRLAPQAVAA
jgi:hypothetical protein